MTMELDESFAIANMRIKLEKLCLASLAAWLYDENLQHQIKSIGEVFYGLFSVVLKFPFKFIILL